MMKNLVAWHFKNVCRLTLVLQFWNQALYDDLQNRFK